MITAEQRRYIEARAYAPEHLPAYVGAIAAAQPHLIGDYVFYLAGERLIFVGYPLSGVYDEATWLAALDAANARFRPRLTAITGAALPASLSDGPASSPDAYYRLDLTDVRPSKKVRNLLRRAERDVTVCETARFGPEHRRLVASFLADVQVDEATRFIFERLGQYVGAERRVIRGLWDALALKIGRARARTSAHGSSLPRSSVPGRILLRDFPVHTFGSGKPCILEARDVEGRLVAFDIAACAAGEYAFYLFSFRDRGGCVPGASDLLLAHIIAQAQARGKRYLNLGLGINAGVSCFKEKWGAAPFLAHVACVRERLRRVWEEALEAV